MSDTDPKNSSGCVISWYVHRTYLMYNCCLYSLLKKHYVRTMQEAINNIIHFLFCTFYIYCTSCTCHKVHSKTTAGFSWDPEINYTKVPNKRLLQNPHLLFSLSTDDPGQPYPGAGHCVHQWSASCPLQVISKCSYRSKNIQVICKCLYRSKNSTLKLSIHLFERKSTVIVVLFP